MSLLGILAVLSASGACSAPTEVERRCHDNEENSRSMFSEILAGTAVKASGTDAQLDAAGSGLWGLGSFPNKQKIAFVSRKPCLRITCFLVLDIQQVSKQRHFELILERT